MRRPTYPLVEVKWLDSWWDKGFVDRDDFEDEFVIWSVGYLVRDETAVISLAFEIHGDEGESEFRGVLHIPRAMVLNIQHLTAGPSGSR